MIRAAWWLWLCALWWIPLGRATETDDVEALLRRTDDLFRGAASRAVVEMRVKTSRYERTMKMEAWSKGDDKSLIRILEPAKDAGVTTLKVGDNLWNYLPRVDRTMKVPTGMMSGAWMGSHFTNDDLVQQTRLSDHFTFDIQERPEAGEGRWVVELTPKPTAPVVWGKVRHEVGADELPRKTTYYDEQGRLVRTMTFEKVEELAGRKLPTVMRLQPADAPEEFTVMEYVELALDVDIDDSKFSLQSLRR